MNILNKLTIKHLLMNKKRTIVTIIGVILSTALMVGIGLLFSSVRDNSVKSIIASNGSQHVIIESVPSNELSSIKNNIHVDTLSYYTSIGFSKVDSKNEYKPYYHIVGASNNFLETLTLKSGRLPMNDTEIVISDHVKNNGGIDIEIGDTLTLNVGKRFFDGEEIMDNEKYMYDEENSLGEQLTQLVKTTYTVVGIVERSYIEDYSAAGYSLFTKGNVNKDSQLTVLATFKNVKKAYEYGNAIAESLGFENLSSSGDSQYYEELTFNDSLLSMSGVSRYDNFMGSIYTTIIIMLSLISIGCIIVIYNSFAISVMERKKQFGLFSSIGATKKQLRKTVFFEAIIVGMIGIPLGIISAFIGIGIVLKLTNILLPDVFEFPLVLAIYPSFIIIPILFMIIVILLSAYLPAVRASRITPIEAIRQNDDIKIKGKKVRTPKIVRLLFGVEGEIALKNIKRNKKKYRITILSLFISIVLFISFSGIVYYGFTSAEDTFNLPDYNIGVSLYKQNETTAVRQIADIVSHPEVEEYTVSRRAHFLTNSFTKEMLRKDFIDKTGFVYDNELGVEMVAVDDKTYESLKRKAKVKNDVPFVINKFKGTIYSNSNRKSYNIEKYNRLPDKISLCESIYEEGIDEARLDCNRVIENTVLVDETILGTEEALSEPNMITLIVNNAMYETYENLEHYPYEIYIKSQNYDDLDTYLEKLTDNSYDNYFYYDNIDKELKLYKNMILVIKILLYGFISLVTLIGVTSVFNTIHTSINLRRKEFAMLRSMGLTPRGFNKILAFESLFVGFKSLLYGLPVSIGVVYLLYKSFGGISDSGSFVVPWDSIWIAVVAVFIIVFITMMYASSKVKKENILEAIREENI